MIFWGTFFPLISEALTGRAASFGPPMFDRLTVPLALVLVLLSGIGPLIAWRRATAASLRRNFVVPIAVAGTAAVIALVLGAGSQPDALIMFTFAGFVIGAVGQELVRGVRARRVMAREPLPLALVSLVRRNRRRYGGYTRPHRDGGAVRRHRRVVELRGRARRASSCRARRRRSAATTSVRAGRPPTSWPPRTGGSSGSTSAPCCA